SGEGGPGESRSRDVARHSLGMVVYRERGLRNSRIIRRNTRIPAEQTRDDYTTSHDNQTTMDLWLVQGEEDDPLNCTVLGHFEFYGIPPRAAGDSQLAVTFRYNANGIVEVEAMDLVTGQILPHRMASGQVSLEDLAHNRAPMQVALIMDCSGSMYGQNITDARAAATSFAERTLDVANRQVAVVAFPGGTRAAATNDLARITQAIEGLTPIGSTPLADGLHDARDLLRPRAGVQRVFVVLTDGHPDDPDATMAEVHRLKASGARVITIGVGSQVQQDFLRTLASQPGDYHFCSESIELRGTFINLATELAGE
ncbi:MAG: VWA domain-containing protein, partial [Myxococcota bacterium]